MSDAEKLESIRARISEWSFIDNAPGDVRKLSWLLKHLETVQTNLADHDRRIKAETAAECAEIAENLQREPRRQWSENTRSVMECDIIVNSALGQVAAAIRAAFRKETS